MGSNNQRSRSQHRSHERSSGGHWGKVVGAVVAVAAFAIYANRDAIGDQLSVPQQPADTQTTDLHLPGYEYSFATSVPVLPPITAAVPGQPAAEVTASTAPAPQPTETTVTAQAIVPSSETTLALPAASPETSPTPTRKARVVAIGDSIAVLKFGVGGYAQVLADNNMELLAHDEKGSRPIVWAPCDVDSTTLACEGPSWDGPNHIGVGDGIRSLEHMAGLLAQTDVVEIDLGQNTRTFSNKATGTPVLEPDLERMLREAWQLSNANGHHAAILIANMAHTSINYVGPPDPRNEIINNVVAKLVAEGEDIRILDVKGIGYTLDKGGVHPTATGAKELAVGEAALVVPIANELRDLNEAAAKPA